MGAPFPLDGSQPLPEIDPLVTCAHLTRRGARCQNLPVEGEDLCVQHGGSIATVKESVQRRLILLQEKSVTVLEEILRAGLDDRTRLAAVIAVFDRTGLGPKSTVEVQDTPDDLSALSREDLARRAEAAAQRLRLIRGGVTAPPQKK